LKELRLHLERYRPSPEEHNLEHAAIGFLLEAYGLVGQSFNPDKKSIYKILKINQRRASRVQVIH
jgi:hypothetical protein